MIRILDTYPALLDAFEGGAFSPERWRAYIDGACPGLAPMLIKDMEETLATGKVTFQKDYLPVLNAVVQNAARLAQAHDAFLLVTDALEARVQSAFGRTLDVDIVFYLGLCNGAGWVTDFDGRTAVLLGVEKILELGWQSSRDMIGLIDHELGHVYQAQYGVLKRSFDDPAASFLWQLFTEGIAMVFEQTLVGDPDFYHQDKDGWKAWCDAHFAQIRRDFDRDLPSMTRANQRYFGDWVSYEGRGDVGYYLGCRFVRHILAARRFDGILSLDMDELRPLYCDFLRAPV